MWLQKLRYIYDEQYDIDIWMNRCTDARYTEQITIYGAMPAECVTSTSEINPLYCLARNTIFSGLKVAHLARVTLYFYIQDVVLYEHVSREQKIHSANECYSQF